MKRTATKANEGGDTMVCSSCMSSLAVCRDRALNKEVLMLCSIERIGCCQREKVRNCFSGTVVYPTPERQHEATRTLS